jgi:hypothetical protein
VQEEKPWWLQPRQKLHHLLLTVGVGSGKDKSTFNILIEPEKETHVMVQATVGHTITNTIKQLDGKGNPMLTPVKYESPPAWTQTTPATDTMAVSADGTSNVLTSANDAGGTDSVTVVAVAVPQPGGSPVSFTATVSVEYDPAPQVLTSIVIESVVS